MSDRPNTSFGTFHWGCGHEPGPASCAQCFDERVAEVDRLKKENELQAMTIRNLQRQLQFSRKRKA